MEGGKKYIGLDDLYAYQLSREYSELGWKVYQKLSWQNKKIIGDQMITSVDSVGANIAEGYGRFHYLDKNKFYFNARGSLFESKHWTDLMTERSLLEKDVTEKVFAIYKQTEIKLNSLIKSQKQQKINIT